MWWALACNAPDGPGLDPTRPTDTDSPATDSGGESGIETATTDTGLDSGAGDTEETGPDTGHEDSDVQTIAEYTATVVYSPSGGDALGSDLVCGTPATSGGSDLLLVAGAQYASPTRGGAYAVPLSADPQISTNTADGHTVGEMHVFLDSMIACAGDSDGDGQNEILMASDAVAYDGLPYMAGVYELPLNGEEDWHDAEFTVWQRFEHTGSWGFVTAGDMDGDGVAEIGMYSLSVASPEDDPHSPGGGVAFFVRGASSSASVEEADITIGHYRDSSLVPHPVPVGDLSGDGYDDLVTFDFAYETDTIYGRIDIIPGPLPASGVVDDLATATIWGEGETGWFNLWVTTEHQADVDGDGALDLSFEAERGLSYPDEWGYFHMPGPLSGSYTASNASDAMIVWTDQFEAQYHDLADLDGDGAVDAIWTNSIDSTATSLGGALYIAWGPLLGFTSAPDTTLYGDVIWAGAGSSLDTYDVDDDGTSDVIIGAPGDRTWAYGGGSVSILLGKDLRALRP